jgi:hypothetical protein
MAAVIDNVREPPLRQMMDHLFPAVRSRVRVQAEMVAPD